MYKKFGSTQPLLGVVPDAWSSSAPAPRVRHLWSVRRKSNQEGRGKKEEIKNCPVRHPKANQVSQSSAILPIEEFMSSSINGSLWMEKKKEEKEWNGSWEEYL